MRSSWQRQLPLLAKLLAFSSIVGYFFWNVMNVTQIAHLEAPSLRSEAPQVVVEGLHDASSHGAVVRDDEEAWWLRPEAYSKESGCDFSAAVALFKPEELELNCANMDQLEIGEYVGKGFWRKVYKTTWNGREVAVKRVKDYLMDRPDIIPRHVEECAAIFSIRNSPNIVGLVGWCKTTVVVDYIPRQLDKLLFESEEPVSVRRALRMARDAARGVAQLHNAPGGPFVHADLQTRQFLIADDGTLKLNDFNRVKYTGPRLVNGIATNDKCTFRTAVAKGKWRSPEEYEDWRLNEKLDIYSLSLVLWTLRARMKPFGDFEREEVYEMVPKGMRPPLEQMSDYPQDMQDLIVRGWDNDPAKRPTADEMAAEIERILANYSDDR